MTVCFLLQNTTLTLVLSLNVKRTKAIADGAADNEAVVGRNKESTLETFLVSRGSRTRADRSSPKPNSLLASPQSVVQWV